MPPKLGRKEILKHLIFWRSSKLPNALLDLWHGHPTAYGRALDPRATHCSQEIILFLLVHEAAGSWKPSHFCRRTLSLFLSNWTSRGPSQELMPCLLGGGFPPQTCGSLVSPVPSTFLTSACSRTAPANSDHCCLWKASGMHRREPQRVAKGSPSQCPGPGRAGQGQGSSTQVSWCWHHCPAAQSPPSRSQTLLLHWARARVFPFHTASLGTHVRVTHPTPFPKAMVLCLQTVRD